MSEDETFSNCPVCGKPIDDPNFIEYLRMRKERGQRLDELIQEHRSLLDRLKQRQISTQDYFEKTNRIGTEYIQILDSIEDYRKGVA